MSPKKNGARNRPASTPRKSAGSRPRQAGGAPRQGGSGRHPNAPAPAASGIYTPGGSAFRHSVERVSAPALLLLTRRTAEGRKPHPAVMFAPLVLLLLGFFLPFYAGIAALVVFLVFTAWLAFLSWPRTDARAKLIRLVMFLLVIALIVIRAVRR